MITVLQKCWLRLEAKFLAKRWAQPVFNANQVPPAPGQKKALLVYLTVPFHLPPGHPIFRRHQSYRQAIQIAQVLGEFGYVVDVLDFKNRSFRPAEPYDLLVNHRVDFAGLEGAIGPRTLKVYLWSGMNHIIHNQNQKARVEYFFKRKGRYPKDLVWDQEEMPFLKIADALLGFGNKTTVNSWKSVFSGPIHGFDNYSLPMPEITDRNYASARKHFLFFGSRQQVGKGLDLLLDVFSKTPHLHLYVCSRYEADADFCACYAQELFHTRNIHPCGFVDIGGRKFRDLVARCGFIIHPSCSEGSPGSVVNAMATGLIPVVSKESGLDVGEGGFTLPDCQVETIDEMVRRVSQMPPDQLEARSQMVLQTSAAQFSETKFIDRWRQILGELAPMAPQPAKP